MSSREKARAFVDSHDWFYSFDLGDGLEARGKKPLDVLNRAAEIVFSEGVQGKSVLDIGAWDGFFSCQAEKCGASRVLATDHYCWSGPEWGTRDGFDWLNGHFNSKVEAQDIAVPDIAPETTGVFDVVLFLGVLYHLKDPLVSLEKVFSVTGENAVIETETGLNDFPEPIMRFYLGAELNMDASNFWVPNHAGLENMLREVGFTRFKFTPPDASKTDHRIRTTVHAFR